MKAKIVLHNGMETTGVVLNDLIHGNETIDGYIPMWKLDTGKCDFFSSNFPWSNTEFDNNGFSIKSLAVDYG